MNDVRAPGRASLSGRLLATYAFVFVVLIGLFGLLTLDGAESILRSQESESLEREARSVAVGIGDTAPTDLQARVDELAAALESRVTVIAPDGTVLADSAFDAAAMENHADRPEVQVALTGSTGFDTRESETTGVHQLYAAVAGEDGRVYRVSITEEQLASQVAAIGTRIGLVALIAGVIGVGLMAIVARRVARPIVALTAAAQDVAAGRLHVRPRRSPIQELDELGTSIARMADDLGNRVTEAEREREILGAVLDALPQGVILIAPDGDVMYGNDPARALVGRVPDRLAQLMPLSLQRLVGDAVALGVAQDVVLDAAGPGPTLRALATPLPDDRVVLVVTDISERIRVERMRRDFVADASHELKTPIASILAASETLQMALERDPDRAARFVTLVHESARQLARIVGDLLDLSRVETSGGGDVPVRVDRVVGDETERLRTEAEEKGIILSAELVEATVLGSSGDLALAVRNLVSNAIRYSSRGDSIRVAVVPDGADVRIDVEDTGTGIPGRALSRVFERFYRVDVARSRETGGTGLGLAIVKHVAEAHGGSVSVESELGVGSTFHLRLPLAAETPSAG